jgi:hypothetical protein
MKQSTKYELRLAYMVTQSMTTVQTLGRYAASSGLSSSSTNRSFALMLNPAYKNVGPGSGGLRVRWVSFIH